MFGSVVMGVFQITFCVKIHVNDVFLFFNISTSKQYKTYKPYEILTKQN